ncbi:glycosyltransferase 61 family protein [Paracoccus marinaquae]|uniref:DUF563 domain-containing protein n=1 Tax=Paracoccus marinaquae TaxID=2841926 RepID=A0ABS6AKZ1_9RHOB|nr:glycosyltransferase 61 family protein [Paracoccus marinaquae]MBU3031253.1 DUF563 domain-containing protein [Paracoccus marinaquae]
MTKERRTTPRDPRYLPAAGLLRYLGRNGSSKLRRAGNPFSDLVPSRYEYEPKEIACRPAIFDAEHLSRVVRCGFDIPLSRAVGILTETRFTETPMVFHDLGQTIIIGGIAVTRDKMFWLKPYLPRLASILANPPEFDRAIIPNSAAGLQFFGHWLGDDCSAYEALRDDPDLMTVQRPARPDARQYEALFDQDWRDDQVVRCRNLVVANDLGFGTGKAGRYRTLRRRLRDRLSTTGNGGGIVYIRRGPSGEQRDIVNAAEFEDRLRASGVDILTPEDGSSEFLSRILDASVVISTEGSQACHAIYGLRDGGALLVLQPPDRFYPAPHEWLRITDMRCGMVIGEARADGFYISPDEVLAMTDRLLALTENRDAV